MGAYKATYRELLSIARDQGGYFTARQALSVGYAYPEQVYHTAHGNWERIRRGIYRLHDYPPADRDDLIVLSLVSIDRSGMPQAVVSYESALAIYNLSDANPARFHLTVPPRFRKSMPSGVMLHRAMLTQEEWVQREGYRVTTPLRTLLDIAASLASISLLADAVQEALQRGIVRQSQLLAAAANEITQARLQAIIETMRPLQGISANSFVEQLRPLQGVVLNSVTEQLRLASEATSEILAEAAHMMLDTVTSTLPRIKDAPSDNDQTERQE